MVDIETAATAELKNRISNTERLSQFINERDKEPIWDGAIYAYHSTSRKNEDMIGRAPVQVKGKTSKRNLQKHPKYNISIVDLEKYRNDGGVLYFVVFLDADKNKKVYYAALQPFLINQYIKLANGKKSISIGLRELPERETELENIVINFIKESEKQVTSKQGKNWTIEEVEELLGRDNVRMNFHFTCIGYDKDDPFSYLKDNEVYLHLQNQDGTLTFPIQHLENVEAMITERNIDIISNGKKYYDKVTVERHRDDTFILCMGKSIKYLFGEKKQSLKYTLAGNLDERIHDIKFVLDVFETKCISINGVELTINPTKKEVKNFDIEGIKSQLNYYELIKQMLDDLHVTTPLDVENLTEKQEEHIKMLINAIVYKKRVGFVEKDQIPPVVPIELSNMRLLLFFRKMDDERYEIYDFFSYEIDCKLDADGDYPTTKYCILNERDYGYSANIDYGKVKADFMKYDNEGHRNRMVLSILEMIKAYDSIHNEEILSVALELCEWLEEKEKDSAIHIINKIQCKIRKRNITDEDIEELKTLEKTESDIQNQAAISILLGNKRMVEHYIKKMEDKNRDIFKNYPIYHLYEEL